MPATSSLWPASRTRPPATRLCATNAPIILERMEFPDPVIELSVEPKTKADQEKMGVALNRLAREDPSFRVTTDHESGQTIIKGMGELHLEILVDRMKREFKVEANVGAPQVAYREYLAKPVELTYTHKKQSGGSGQFGEIKINVMPGERGSGIQFFDEIKGGNVPKEYIPVGREGHARDRRDRVADRLPDHRLRDPPDRRQVSRRRLLGAGVRDLRPRRDARSGAEVGHQAARADHEGRGRDSRRIIWATSSAISISRRGQIQGTDTRGNAQVVEAMVPLANMFGYVNQLRSFSQGRAQYTMQFSHYDEVPQNVADEVKAKLA